MRLETTLSVMEGNMEDLMMIKCRLSVNVTVPCCRPTEVGVWVHDRIRLLDPVIVLLLLANISLKVEMATSVDPPLHDHRFESDRP
jgi:hypothetical protein